MRFNFKTLFLFFIFALFIRFTTSLAFRDWTLELNPKIKNTEIALISGDATSYITPIENYIKTGTYYINQNGTKVFHGRGPYYGIVYFLFRLIFNEDNALTAVVCFQIIIETLSIIYLSMIVLIITGKRKSFYITYFISIINLQIAYYNNCLITESLSVSFLIFFMYNVLCFKSNKSNSNFLFLSIFLAIVCVLKPYFLPLFAIPIYEIFKQIHSLKLKLKYVLVLILPFCIIVTPYTIRNLKHYNVFLPLSEKYAGYNYTSADFAYRKFVQAWGGSFVFWDKNSAGCYFEPKPDLPCNFVIPKYALCNAYTSMDIEKTRDLFIQYQKDPNNNLQDSVTNAFNRLTKLYIEERPFQYYVMKPLRLVRIFLIHSGSFYLPINYTNLGYLNFKWYLKILQSIFYYFILFAGFAGLYILIKRHLKLYFLGIVPVGLIVLFPLYLNSTEFRYFVCAVPFLIIGSSYFLIIKKAKKNNEKIGNNNSI